jgi:hypothetical protein
VSEPPPYKPVCEASIIRARMAMLTNRVDVLAARLDKLGKMLDAFFIEQRAVNGLLIESLPTIERERE